MDSKSIIVDVSESPSNHVTQITLDDMYKDESVDVVYQAKSRVLNKAIQEIGMGKYQKQLFICAGFGWFADSVWPLAIALILTQTSAEFNFNGPYLTLAANVGLLVGPAIWSVGCDTWGRKWPFNLTLLIAGVFGTAAGGSPDFVTLACLLAIVCVGVGGNLPVDSAVFLDLVPGTHQYLLTLINVWWSVGSLLGSLLAWPLIADYSCPEDASVCDRADNMGWRYLLFTLGGVTLLFWFLRLFYFDLLESPRFLISVGKDAEAVSIIHKIAKYNGTTTDLTVEHLNEAAEKAANLGIPIIPRTATFGLQHVKGLFSTTKMAVSTTLLIALWAIIGLAYNLYNCFLPYLLTTRGIDFGDGSLYITYRNQFILSVIGIVGALVAGWTVEVSGIGRKGTLAISMGLTGIFLLASTTSRSSNALLGWNCGYNFSINMMWGVMYAFSAEIFPAPHRGTGNGLVNVATAAFGVLAPIVALYANLSTSVPVYISGTLFVFSGFLALFLPYEPYGKASI
ncbi:MFS general substrate transporter [Desarmillaria tabescens]|uniref:MFS general substrate transporter n=1 Tax=Armillaria tabescens TaxID=1929756 RepID=A0AA39JM25_ARMTA|nr:MFS general substrate transporter [Desarmillaria tabescens]KAK0445019.1 MFS general substrate transporter [Desarmillaria tabescens]